MGGNGPDCVQTPHLILPIFILAITSPLPTIAAALLPLLPPCQSDPAHVVSCLKNGGESAFVVGGCDLRYDDLRVFDFLVHLLPLLGVEVEDEELCVVKSTSYFFKDSLIPPENPFRSSMRLMMVRTPFSSYSKDSSRFESHFARSSFSLMARALRTSSNAFWICPLL